MIKCSPDPDSPYISSQTCNLILLERAYLTVRIEYDNPDSIYPIESVCHGTSRIS